MIFQIFLCERLECIYSVEHNFFSSLFASFSFLFIEEFHEISPCDALGPRLMIFWFCPVAISPVTLIINLLKYCTGAAIVSV